MYRLLGTRLSDTVERILLVDLREFSQTILQALPSGDAFADRLVCGFGYIVAGSLAVLATEIDIEVRAMLWPGPVAPTSGRTAGTIGFGGCAEDRPSRILLNLL